MLSAYIYVIKITLVTVKKNSKLTPIKLLYENPFQAWSMKFHKQYRNNYVKISKKFWKFFHV